MYVFVLGAEKDAIFFSEKKGGEGRARKKLEAEVDVLFQHLVIPLISLLSTFDMVATLHAATHS